MAKPSRVVQALLNVSEEKFVKTVEEDIERIGRFVSLQSESVHLRLHRLLQLTSDLSYVRTVEYLKGAHARGPPDCTFKDPTCHGMPDSMVSPYVHR